ncbi:MAG: hypothetical protein KDC45_05575, partial [Bacteroidetes bacterium]|nr:hypothetical protein [Bacteroidota bacterium]
MRSLLRSSSKPTVTKNPFALEAAVRAICLGIELLLGRVTKLVPFAIFVCLLGLTQGDELRAQWSTSPTVNNAVSTPAGDQRYPQTVSDGAGGTIIVWEDSRSGTADIYAQRLNASGVAQWTANGVVICNAANIQGGPRIISDGAGGAIITWYDLRNGGGNYDIYAQRVNSSGTVQWTANGVVITSAANSQTSPRIAGDGSGGAIIAWTDLRNGTDNDIFAQRINSSGVTQWTANGDTVCVAPFSQAIGGIVSDGASGAIIAWEDMRNGVDNRMYGQRINGAGVSQWTSNGIALGTGTGNQDTPGIEADGSGGAFIAWRDLRNADYDLYAQRVNSAGSLLW